MNILRVSVTIFLVLFGLSSLYAQDERKAKTQDIPYIKVIDCIECSGLVILLPSPIYPSLVGTGPPVYNGKVAVQIIIDENGKVEKAEGISGHQYFRPMLETEAFKAKFRPKVVDGKAVRSTGVIVFLVVSRADEAEKTGLQIIPKPKSTIVSCGVCNQAAIFLPKPYYPESARFVGASGKVTIQIVIDENGFVESAKAISGNALLRTASEQAARNSIFIPLTLGKIPIKSTGLIVYNFNL